MSGYTQVTEDQNARFLMNKGLRDGMTVGEARFIAERFDWPDYVIYGSASKQEVTREALLGGSGSEDDSPNPYFVPRWRMEDNRRWLEINDGDLNSLCVNSAHSIYPIEIYKQVDDWFWVVLNLNDKDFFYRSPVLQSGSAAWPRIYTDLYYRCDQMAGLVSLLEWACPMDRIKK